ncbi:COX15/CtaA family protein [Coralloluteibacterium thermophilus]|uniref:Heme A synthase n=1 Tax=Coralloluteibacterium thermophilum TaxID=2707049 RepID=A0ABV9NJ83_9GAMM
MYKHTHRIAWFALALALVVIVFGAFVRLSDAGLSCPDWPTCYGRATWPTQEAHFAHAEQNFARPVESHKAWREQVHRHLAALLGVGVLALALLAARRRRFGIATILGASLMVAVAIPLYMQGQHVAASVLAALAEVLLLLAAWRWSNQDLSRVATLLLAVIIFQALLGMWTVTWLLKPVVVMAHLLGGLATFSLLAFLAWRATPDAPLVHSDAPRLRGLLGIGLVLLVVQIALGGWTSANYAALACGTDFPTCLGQWWPAADWREGFVLWRGIGVDYEGGVLDGEARVAIQMAHRLMAVVVFGHLLAVALRLWRTTGLRHWGVTLGVLLIAQVALGISNVHFGLPLAVAVAHNAGAVLLLFVLVTLLTRLRVPS